MIIITDCSQFTLVKAILNYRRFMSLNKILIGDCLIMVKHTRKLQTVWYVCIILSFLKCIYFKWRGPCCRPWMVFLLQGISLSFFFSIFFSFPPLTVLSTLLCSLPSCLYFCHSAFSFLPFPIVHVVVLHWAFVFKKNIKPYFFLKSFQNIHTIFKQSVIITNNS